MPLMRRQTKHIALVVALSIAGGAAEAASDGVKSKSGAEKAVESEVAKYCSNIAPSAAEARLNYQMRRLTELEGRVSAAVEALGKREDEAKDWVQKRQEMMKAASEDLVSIYGKMSPEAAAAQIATMDDRIAASLLSKLKPQLAATILNEMDPDKAGHLTSIISGGALTGTGKT